MSIKITKSQELIDDVPGEVIYRLVQRSGDTYLASLSLDERELKELKVWVNNLAS